MKIYLAGGMSLITIEGRELEFCRKFPTWK